MHQINEFALAQSAQRRESSDNKITRRVTAVVFVVCVVLFKCAIGG